MKKLVQWNCYVDIVHLQQVFISQTLSFDLFAFPQTIAFSSRKNVEKTTLNILTSIYFQLLTFFNSCHICHNCISPNSSSTPIQMYRTHQSQSGQLVSPRPHLSHWVSPPSAIASPDLIISQFMQGWLLLYEPDTGKYIMELWGLEYWNLSGGFHETTCKLGQSF